jgi:hypothetical protein
MSVEPGTSFRKSFLLPRTRLRVSNDAAPIATPHASL